MKIIIEGRVQGVGYRYFVLAEAKRMGLLGTVRNLYDGNVEVVAQGDDEALERFKAALKEGPRMGFVRNIRVAEVVNPPKFLDFRMVY